MYMYSVSAHAFVSLQMSHDFEYNSVGNYGSMFLAVLYAYLNIYA